MFTCKPRFDFGYFRKRDVKKVSINDSNAELLLLMTCTGGGGGGMVWGGGGFSDVFKHT